MKLYSRAWPFFLMLLLSACAPGPVGNSISGDAPSHSAIVGGQIEKENSPLAASVVMIATQDEKGNSLNCTATFVAKHWILTAAHCVNKDASLISLLFSRTPYDDEKSQMLTADFVVIHDKALVDDKDRNDLAMIHFIEDLPAGARVALLPAATNSLAKSSTLQFRAVGYGRTDGLEHDATDMVGSGVLRSVSLQSLNVSNSKHSFTVNQTAGHGVCFGDSGGPALIVKTSQVQIVGVASGVYGDGQDSCNHSSLYMNVASYLDWIQLQIKKPFRIQKPKEN